MIGRTLGRYRILAPLGQGGMGSVWKAEDPLLNRIVALKVLPKGFAGSPRARERFLREAEAASALNHPGVATVYDAGEAEDAFYLAVAFVDGETLSARVQRRALPIEVAVRVACAAAEALGHAHARGVLHRDVSSRNIMIARDGSVVVLDFGLARRRGRARITTSGVAMGTLAYMAPEVVQGAEADERSDLYGLGVVLFEMLTGRLPFHSDQAETVIYAAVNELPEPPSRLRPRVPPELDRITLRALAKEPALRYGKAEDMLADLREVERLRPWKRDSGTARRRAPSPALQVPPLHVRDAGAPRLPLHKHLAVLPFAESGAAGGSDAQVFARGLADTVSASLARYADLQVIPPPAAAQSGGTEKDVRTLARQLGANLVLCGSVQRSRDHVRLSYSLLNPHLGIQLAGDTVDGSLADLFAAEDTLVNSIAAALELRPAPAARATARRSLRDPAAHEHYLQALGYLQRYENEAAVDGALALLERLQASEGDSALVLAALGRACRLKYTLTSRREWEERAVAACRRALQLDPRSPEVLVTLGTLHSDTGRSAEAARAFKRALALRPGHPDALIGLSVAEEQRGRFAEAEQACREAIAARPEFWGGYNRLGVIQFNQGRYARAAESWRRVVELTPDNARGHYNLAAAYFRLDRFEDALAAYRRSIAIQPTAGAYTSLGTVHFYMGNYVEAAAMFEKGAALRPNDPLMWGNLGDAYRWRPGMLDQAEGAYDKAIALAREQLQVNPRDPLGWARLAHWLAKRGERREAERALRRTLRSGMEDVTCMAIAGFVYHLVGRRAEALGWLARAVEHGYGVAELQRDPELTELRGDPEFERIIRRGRSTVTAP